MIEFNRFLRDRVSMRIFVGFYVAVVLVLYGFTHTLWGLRIAGKVLCGTPFEERICRKSLARYGNPLEQALVSREIRAGHPVASAKENYGFDLEIPLGRYTIIYPRPSGCRCYCILYAKDGCLAVARSTFGPTDVIHFDTLTPNEWAELRELEEQYHEEQSAARYYAQMAVAGGAFFKDSWMLPYNDEPASDSPDELP